MVGIYKIKNLINNKIYIGQSHNIEERIKRHKKRKDYEEYKDIHLYRAMRKYGIENFSFEIIEECSIDRLDEREIYWIKYYNSFNEGYNETLGGGGGTLYDYNQIKNLWDEGLNVTEISKYLNCNKGTVERALNSYNCRNRQERGFKPVCQYTLQGNFLKEYESIAEAARQTKCDPTAIVNCCKHKIKQTKNYCWSYKGEQVVPYQKRNYHVKNSQSIPVEQYDLKDNLLNTFYSAGEAGRQTGADASAITKCCKGKLKTTKGFKWKYA